MFHLHLCITGKVPKGVEACLTLQNEELCGHFVPQLDQDSDPIHILLLTWTPSWVGENTWVGTLRGRGEHKAWTKIFLGKCPSSHYHSHLYFKRKKVASVLFLLFWGFLFAFCWVVFFLRRHWEEDLFAALGKAPSCYSKTGFQAIFPPVSSCISSESTDEMEISFSDISYNHRII